MKKLSKKLNQMLLRGKLRLKNLGQDLFTNERGDTNIIAIILILVVVIGLVIIFREQITSLVRRIFESINDKTDEVLA